MSLKKPIKKFTKRTAKILKSFRLPEETVEKINQFAKELGSSDADAISHVFKLHFNEEAHKPISLQEAMIKYRLTAAELAEFIKSRFIAISVSSIGRRSQATLEPFALAKAIQEKHNLVEPYLICSEEELNRESSIKEWQIDPFFPLYEDKIEETNYGIRYRADVLIKWESLILSSEQINELVEYFNYSKLTSFYKNTEFSCLRYQSESIPLTPIQTSLIKHIYLQTKNGKGAKPSTFREYIEKNKLPLKQHKFDSFSNLFSREKYKFFIHSVVKKNNGHYFLKL